MIKIKIANLLIILICTITLLLWLFCISLKNRNPYRLSRDCRSYHIEAETLESWEQKVENQKLKILGFSGWSIDGEGVVECTGLNKSSNAAVIKIYGTPEYVLNRDILTGSLGYEIHEHDCIISEALAYDLFGSTDIAGEKVILDGKRYTIVCVIKDNDSFICLPLQDGKVEYIEVMLENKKNADRIIDALLK